MCYNLNLQALKTTCYTGMGQGHCGNFMLLQQEAPKSLIQKSLSKYLTFGLFEQWNGEQYTIDMAFFYMLCTFYFSKKIRIWVSVASDVMMTHLLKLAFVCNGYFLFQNKTMEWWGEKYTDASFITTYSSGHSDQFVLQFLFTGIPKPITLSIAKFFFIIYKKCSQLAGVSR